MRTLKVWKFSSITEAVLPISPITVLIGPQASGKSVLCKLSYFFSSLLDEQIKAVVEHLSHEEFSDEVRNKFIRWFPPETWGKHKFEISFEFGSCVVQIVRTVSGGRPGKGIKIKFCDTLLTHFATSAKIMADRDLKKRSELDSSELTYGSWRLERAIRDDLQRELKGDFVTSQLFIPAGRSFFTSVGKAIAAFENSNMLDPVTVVFGRMYALRDSAIIFEDSSIDRTIRTLIERATVDMLGGHLVRERERDREVLKTADGRTIPLSALSSGQQEVFPLLKVLPTFMSKTARRIIYVEEPEAHLFPEAQSKLVILLAALMNAYGPTNDMVITTHSPYVLTKFNNLLLAGQLGRRKNKLGAVGEIIPQESWIQRGHLGAYALADGKLKDLMDPTGLIDGDYLDSVSNQMGAEFTSLLDIELPLPS